MSRKLNWIIKKIILYIYVAGLSSKTPTGRENSKTDFHDFIKFSAKRQLLLLMLPTTSIVVTNNVSNDA